MGGSDISGTNVQSLGELLLIKVLAYLGWQTRFWLAVRSLVYLIFFMASSDYSNAEMVGDMPLLL